MNRNTHIAIGIIVSVIISFWIDGTFLLVYTTFGYAIIGGVIGSLLPDVIEPPYHYTHREFFHSVSMMRYLLISMLVSFALAFLAQWIWFVFFVIIGYIMHLLADGTTPMGLPD